MRSPRSNPSLDLKTLAGVYQAREASPQDILDLVLERIAAYGDPAVWIHRIPREELLTRARAVEQRREAGESLPLFGVPFGIKDTIDLAGHPTTAACPAYSYVPERSAPVVERLLDAGAIPVGKTNLDQFGTGLAGDRSPYGACRNVFDPAYISGGSSSGSAVAVAAGLVSFALGTDTAGSGRVPAAANNIVGLKQAHGMLSTVGVVPSCASLDCISFLSLTVEDSAQLYSLALGQDWLGEGAGDGRLATFSTPRDEDLNFFGDEERAELFGRSLKRLEQGGARSLRVDFAPFREVALLLYEGPWVAERLAALEDFVKLHPDEMVPVTRQIIEGGSKYSAVDAFRGGYRLEALREICLRVFDEAEVLVVPTMPTLPTLAEVQGDSIGWSRRLGTYTNFANLLGLCALALPAGFTQHGLPVGITLLGRAGSERQLCEIGMAWQRQSDLPLGATGIKLPPSTPRDAVGPLVVSRTSTHVKGRVRVAVAGAHLRGQPLHAALCRFGARFVRACRTAPKYRFFAFMNLDPPRPGLLRSEDEPGAVAVETYDLSMEGFGCLVASVAPPLAIGTVELEDGESVKGFLCESCAAREARDITDFGGWVAFRDHVSALTTSNVS